MTTTKFIEHKSGCIQNLVNINLVVYGKQCSWKINKINFSLLVITR